MPATDYTDPETTFPRLEVRIQKLEADSYFLTIWLWEKVGVRRRIMNQKWSGSYPDAHEFIRKCAKENDAEVGSDDIISE
jgi:hypothetical protein